MDIASTVGDEHMTADRRDRVLFILRALQIPAVQKRYLYARWCRLVACSLSLDELDQVARLED